MTWWEYGLAFAPSSFFEWTQVTMRDRGQDLCIHCVHTLSFLHSSLAFHLPFWAWICKCPACHPLWILCPFWEISCYKAGKGLLCPECPNPIMRNKAETRNSLSKPTSPTSNLRSHILKHFDYQEGSACKFYNLSASSLCKELQYCGIRGNPERQGNGCGRLLMGPSSP